MCTDVLEKADSSVDSECVCDQHQKKSKPNPLRLRCNNLGEDDVLTNRMNVHFNRFARLAAVDNDDVTAFNLRDSLTLLTERLNRNLMNEITVADSVTEFGTALFDTTQQPPLFLLYISLCQFRG